VGHQSRIRQDRKKQEVIHRTKLFGGVKTAAEVNAELGWRQRCAKCSGAPVIKVRMFMLYEEFVKRAPQLAVAIAASNPDGPFIPTVPTTFGPMVKYASVCACRSHQKELELTAAKAPSYILVEIDRGPGADKPVVQVVQHA
jgi:hypothetical protein